MSDHPGDAADAGPADPPRVGDPEPLLRVVRGYPDPAQLAALVAVLAAASARGAAESSASTAGPDPWRDHARRLGAPPSPGPGVWPTSARP